MSQQISRAGEWFLESGIQEKNGGVARYFRSDTGRNNPVSTEITGYSASALVHLHALTGRQEYVDRAAKAAEFLTRIAWNGRLRGMPFEPEPENAASYFFDCGIIVRGLLAVWRATGTAEYLDVASDLGAAMLEDFFAGSAGEFHPVISLPEKRPMERDAGRWSRSPGCYQLKAALGWWELHEATGESQFRDAYEQVMEFALRTAPGFLPGHPDRLKVVDRLHAYLYFLEGLLPRAGEKRCATALCTGIRAVAGYVRSMAAEFERSDVYAQLLRVRLCADAAGVAPLDREAAETEARILAGFQLSGDDPRIEGGFCFGNAAGASLPYVTPVSTAFAVEAFAMWEAYLAGRSAGARPPI